MAAVVATLRESIPPAKGMEYLCGDAAMEAGSKPWLSFPTAMMDRGASAVILLRSTASDDDTTAA
jgi:hypothetical protein